LFFIPGEKMALGSFQGDQMIWKKITQYFEKWPNKLPNKIMPN
jgi:hypothetical protein